MRLIDANELILHLNYYALQVAPFRDLESTYKYNTVQECIKAVDEQPTAYDVDKVVHEINNKIQELDAKQQLFIENGLLNMADKMASKIGIYIECREIVEKAGN